MSSRIGVVVPTFNGERYLGETLSSIASQTYRDWQCVVVDDGSQDGTLMVARRFAEFDARFRVVSVVNAGISAARNLGFEHLQDCDYVGFMDHDDLWAPDLLATLLRSATSTGLQGAHCLAKTVDDQGRDVGGFADFQRARAAPSASGFRPLQPHEPTSWASCLFVNRVYPPGVLLVRRESYLAAGPWDSSYQAVQDWDMVLRLLEMGELSFVNTVLVSYRRHNANESGDWRRNTHETRRLHVAVFARAQQRVSQRVLRSWWRQWERLKLAECIGELPAPKALIRMMAHLIRYVRGHPSMGPFG